MQGTIGNSPCTEKRRNFNRTYLHGGGKLIRQIKIRIMELSGFKVFHKWTPAEYIIFLENNGFTVTDSEICGGGLTLTYAEAMIKE